MAIPMKISCQHRCGDWCTVDTIGEETSTSSDIDPTVVDKIIIDTDNMIIKIMKRQKKKH